MAQTREHHYVPKFLLSQFARSEGYIDAYQFKKDRLRLGVKLKTQCKERDFYGKDGAIEDAFQKLESPASEIIGKIVKGRLDTISPDDLFLLRHFILYQSARTKVAAREAEAHLEANMKGVLKTEPIRDQFERQFGDKYEFSELDKIRIKFTNTQYVALNAAIGALPAILDLDMKILVSKGDVEFILSDGPVVRCNQFAEFHTKFCGGGGTRGFASKGLQVFMPINPLLCLALYDGDTYACGSPKRPWVAISKKDCVLLNSLQALHADEFLYKSPSGPSIDELSDYVRFRNHQFSSFTAKSQVSSEYVKGNGEYGQLIITSVPDVHTYKKLSFMPVKDISNYENWSCLPFRSARLVEDLRRWEEGMKKKACKNQS